MPPPTDFATLIGKPPTFFTFPYKEYTVDFMAAGLVVACCVLLIFTTAGGAPLASQLVLSLCMFVRVLCPPSNHALAPFTSLPPPKLTQTSAKPATLHPPTLTQAHGSTSQ